MGGSAASNVGVPTGRGPPPLGGIQTIGQSAAGIPSGGPAGGQAPSQAPTPGVQSQPPQGPAPTTTPPVHTPSPQEMGKQAHLQTQPASLQQVYVPAQNRAASQVYTASFIHKYFYGRRIKKKKKNMKIAQNQFLQLLVYYRAIIKRVQGRNNRVVLIIEVARALAEHQ